MGYSGSGTINFYIYIYNALGRLGWIIYLEIMGKERILNGLNIL